MGNEQNKKKKYLDSELKWIQSAAKKINPNEELYFEGIYGNRRKKAILNYLDRAETEFRSFGLLSVQESFVRNELIPFVNYNRLDGDCDLRIGAALWILECLRANNRLFDAYDILPDMSTDMDSWYLPVDFSHPCYANDLIRAVIEVITYRYPQDDRTVITESNARGIEPEQTYTELIGMIPEDKIEKACNVFREKVWELAARNLKGQGYFDSNIRQTADEIPTIPGTTFFAPQASKFSPLSFLDDPSHDLAMRGMSLIEKENSYPIDFDKYLQMDRRTIRKKTGSRELADALSGFTVDDPYELCFALFYLMDTGDDAPWLMRSGHSLMLYVLRMLPWYVDQDDWDDDEWDAWYDGLIYNQNGWQDRETVRDQIDFLHEKHNGRSYAQLIYGLSRAVVPVNMHPFDQDRERLIEEGMDPDNARKITETADLLFLTAFQAKQMMDDDWDIWNDEEEETEEKPGDEAEDETDEENEKLNELKAENESLKKQLKNLKNVLATTRQESNNERAKYEQELKALRLEHRELADLRELVFNQETSGEEQERRERVEKEIDYPYLTQKQTVVFGGHDTWLKAIRPMLPDVKFVDVQQYSFSPEIVRNADVVWIQNNCISHSQYGSIVRLARQHGIQVRYFGYASAEKCAEQLVTEDQK